MTILLNTISLFLLFTGLLITGYAEEDDKLSLIGFLMSIWGAMFFYCIHS